MKEKEEEEEEEQKRELPLSGFRETPIARWLCGNNGRGRVWPRVDVKIKPTGKSRILAQLRGDVWSVG